MLLLGLHMPTRAHKRAEAGLKALQVPIPNAILFSEL